MVCVGYNKPEISVVVFLVEAVIKTKKNALI